VEQKGGKTVSEYAKWMDKETEADETDDSLELHDDDLADYHPELSRSEPPHSAEQTVETIHDDPSNIDASRQSEGNKLEEPRVTYSKWILLLRDGLRNMYKHIESAATKLHEKYFKPSTALELASERLKDLQEKLKKMETVFKMSEEKLNNTDSRLAFFPLYNECFKKKSGRIRVRDLPFRFGSAKGRRARC